MQTTPLQNNYRPTGLLQGSPGPPGPTGQQGPPGIVSGLMVATICQPLEAGTAAPSAKYFYQAVQKNATVALYTIAAPDLHTARITFVGGETASPLFEITLMRTQTHLFARAVATSN